MSIIQNIPTWLDLVTQHIQNLKSTSPATSGTALWCSPDRWFAVRCQYKSCLSYSSCLEHILIDVMLQSFTHSCVCEEIGLSKSPWFLSVSWKCENAACLHWHWLPVSFSFRMSSGFSSPFSEEQTTIVCQACCFYSSSQWIFSRCCPCGWWICFWQPPPGTRLGWAFSLQACQGDIYVF